MNQDETSRSTSHPRPVRKRNPDESKKRILDSAERAFALRGFDGARLRDIAQDAGVHHALVHHYFTDKRGLFEEVLLRGMSLLADLQTFRLSPGRPLRENLQRVVDPLYDFFADNRNLLRVIEGGLRDKDSVPFEVAANILGNVGKPLVEQLATEIEGARQRSEMRADMPVTTIMRYGLSVIMSPFIVGSGLSNALGLPRASQIERDEAKRQIVELLAGALANVPS